MIHVLRTIDSHTAGEPLRLVTDGMPTPQGATMLEKRAWAQKRLDHLRRAVMLEPRGHADMYGALLTEPVHPDSQAGVCTSSSCAHSAAGASNRLAGATMPSARIRSRVMAYFAIGNLCPSGSGRTKWSE